jgi:hypothetical protein
MTVVQLVVVSPSEDVIKCVFPGGQKLYTARVSFFGKFCFIFFILFIFYYINIYNI